MIFKIENFKIGTKIILGFLIVTIPATLISIFSILNLQRAISPLNQELPATVSSLVTHSKLDNLAQLIRYYDETLTQSARNYAFTSQIEWKDRYNQDAPLLDSIISEAIALGGAEDKNFFESVNSANIALIKMESDAMSLVDENKSAEAINILESKEYSDQKTIYKNGLVEYVTHRGADYNQVLSISTEALEKATQNSKNILNITIVIVIFSVILNILVAAIFGHFFSRIISNPIKDLKNMAMDIAKGKEGARAVINSKDEVGELAKVFNFMADRWHDSKANIEKKVVERTAQLEKLNSFMTGREIKMAELKKKIIELEAKKNN